MTSPAPTLTAAPGAHIDYSMLPGHMQECTRAYVEHGQPPGDFLAAALKDQLVGSYMRADDENAAAMSDWAFWLYGQCPMPARGSAENVAAWVAHRGLEGTP